MNVALPDEEILGIIELLAFVAQLCDAQEPLISAALAHFVGVDVYGAAELRLEAIGSADFLARVLGFADASLEAR